MGLKNWISGGSDPAISGEAIPGSGVGLRVLETEGYRVELDLSAQVLGIDILDDVDFNFSLGTDDSTTNEIEPSIAPTLKEVSEPNFASTAVLAQKAKQVDDRIYAAVEVAVQEGAGRFHGKAHLLKTILRQDGPLPPPLFAAAQLGGLDVAEAIGGRESQAQAAGG